MAENNSQHLFLDLVRFIRTSYSPEEKEKMSKDGSKTIFFRKSGKSLCYIVEKDGKYSVTVVIGITLADKVQDAEISAKTKTMFEQAKQFYDGKWLFFQINEAEDIEDIKALLMIKRPLVNRILR